MERRSFLSLGFIAGVGLNENEKDPGRAEVIDIDLLHLASTWVNENFEHHSCSPKTWRYICRQCTTFMELFDKYGNDGRAHLYRAINEFPV